MEKSIDLMILKTKQNILEAINNSGLPITILQMIVNEMKNAVDSNCQQQMATMQQEYQKSLKDDKSEKIENKKDGEVKLKLE